MANQDNQLSTNEEFPIIDEKPINPHEKRLRKHTIIGVIATIFLVIEILIFAYTGIVGLSIPAIVGIFLMGIFYFPIEWVILFIGIPFGIFIASNITATMLVAKIKKFGYPMSLLASIILCIIQVAIVIFPIWSLIGCYGQPIWSNGCSFF